MPSAPQGLGHIDILPSFLIYFFHIYSCSLSLFLSHGFSLSLSLSLLIIASLPSMRLSVCTVVWVGLGGVQMKRYSVCFLHLLYEQTLFVLSPDSLTASMTDSPYSVLLKGSFSRLRCFTKQPETQCRRKWKTVQLYLCPPCSYERCGQSAESAMKCQKKKEKKHLLAI